MTNITGTMEQLQSGNDKLVLRLRKMIVLMAPETGTVITSIVNSAGTALSIPDDYKTVGYLGKDEGGDLKPSMSKSDSTAYGHAQPINEYVDTTDFTFGFTMKETNRPTLEAYYGLDLSALQAKFTTREITWDVPDLPDVKYNRLLVVGQHREGSNAIWVGQWLPKATLSDIGDQKMSDKDDFTYPVTYRAMVDGALGTSRRPFIAGPGLAGLGTTPMGFAVATS